MQKKKVYETKEQRQAYNKVTNKRNYEKNKELFENNPDMPRVCRNCKEEKTLKDFYKSDIYNCKECFKIKNNERRRLKRQQKEGKK